VICVRTFVIADAQGKSAVLEMINHSSQARTEKYLVDGGYFDERDRCNHLRQKASSQLKREKSERVVLESSDAARVAMARASWWSWCWSAEEQPSQPYFLSLFPLCCSVQGLLRSHGSDLVMKQPGPGQISL